MRKFTSNGYQIEQPDPSFEQYRLGNFNGRLPIVYRPTHRMLYVGGRDWYHSDVYDYNGLRWSSTDYREGYMDSEGLTWYASAPSESDELFAALREAGVLADPAQAVWE